MTSVTPEPERGFSVKLKLNFSLTTKSKPQSIKPLGIYRNPAKIWSEIFENSYGRKAYSTSNMTVESRKVPKYGSTVCYTRTAGLHHNLLLQLVHHLVETLFAPTLYLLWTQ